MKADHRVLVACVLFLGAQPCSANNSYFLPGDAFFHTKLTEEVVTALAKQENPRFTYGMPFRGGARGCGYAGYSELEFVKMPKAFKENLKRLYDDLRTKVPKQIEITDEVKEVEKDGEIVEVLTGKKLRTEINGFSVFFYNDSFDFNRYRLCLRYNEGWVQETVAFGHLADHVWLEYFVDSAEAFVTEWRDAAAVKPLNAICPKLPKLNPGDEQPEFGPVRVTSGIRAIVLPVRDFKAYCSPSPNDPPHFFEVTEAGIKKYAFKEGKWQVDAGDAAK